MWNKIMALSVVILIIITLSFSQKSSIYPQLKEKADKIDPRQVPTIFKTLYGNERINVDVETYTKSTMRLGIVTKDSKIIEFEPRYISNPTMKCYTSENFLISLLTTDNVVESYNYGIVTNQLYCEKIVE